jgi:hypothetical protein
MRERRCASVFLLFVLASTEPARGQGSVWGAPAVTVTHDSAISHLPFPIRPSLLSGLPARRSVTTNVTSSSCWPRSLQRINSPSATSANRVPGQGFHSCCTALNASSIGDDQQDDTTYEKHSSDNRGDRESLSLSRMRFDRADIENFLFPSPRESAREKADKSDNDQDDSNNALRGHAFLRFRRCTSRARYRHVGRNSNMPCRSRAW